MEFMATPVVAPAAPVAAPSNIASATSALSRGFSVLSTGISNLEANLGKRNSFELTQPFVGPLAQGEEPAQLTTMQKASNIVKSAHNLVDAGGAAAARGIFGSVEQLFGSPQVVASPDAILFSGVDANGNEVYVNNNGETVRPAGALLASIQAQDGAFTVNAKQEVVNAQGERVDLAGVAVKDHRIFNLAGRVANVVAHVAAIAVRIATTVLGIFASLLTVVIGGPVGGVVALVIGAVRGIQNKAADQFNAMRAQTILINMARNASDSENDIRASLSFINQFCPAVIDPATGNEITSNIAETTAQQARILLNAKLDAIKAAYDATYIGMAVNGVKAGASKVAGAVSSVAAFANNHKKALAVGGVAAAAVGTGAYMGAGPAILDGLRTAVPSVFGLSAAAQAAQAAANRPSLLSTAAYYGLGLLGLGTLGTAGYAEYRIRKDLAQDGQVVAHDPEYNPHPHVVGHPSPEDAFNGKQTDIRAARQQDVVPPTDAPSDGGAADRSRYLMETAFGPAPVNGGNPSGLPQDNSLMKGPDQVVASTTESTAPVARPYVAPLISGSRDRSPPQSPRDATPNSSDDEGSGYNSGLNWESDNLLFGGFPGGEFPNWYPDDDRRDK